MKSMDATYILNLMNRYEQNINATLPHDMLYNDGGEEKSHGPELGFVCPISIAESGGIFRRFQVK